MAGKAEDGMAMRAVEMAFEAARRDPRKSVARSLARDAVARRDWALPVVAERGRGASVPDPKRVS